MPRFERLLEKWRIVERRNGEVYRTERIGEEWVDQDVPTHAALDGDVFYQALSTERTKELNHVTFRRSNV